MNSIKVCEYSRSRSFHDDLILQDQASGERSQDHWSSGFLMTHLIFLTLYWFYDIRNIVICKQVNVLTNIIVAYSYEYENS